MSQEHERNGFILKWGHELAILLVLAGMAAAVISIILAAVAEREIGGAVVRGLAYLGVGGLAAAFIIWLRKRRERAIRPEWMGSTTQWRDEMKAQVTKDN